MAMKPLPKLIIIGIAAAAAMYGIYSYKLMPSTTTAVSVSAPVPAEKVATPVEQPGVVRSEAPTPPAVVEAVPTPPNDPSQDRGLNHLLRNR